MSKILLFCRKYDSVGERKRNIFSYLVNYREKAWERKLYREIRDETFPIHSMEAYGFLSILELLLDYIQVCRLTGDCLYEKLEFCSKLVCYADDILNFPRAQNLQRRT